jgi:hypothetical protein
LQVAVARTPRIRCTVADGVVQGTIAGLDPKEVRPRVYVAGLNANRRFMPRTGSLATVSGGRFSARAPRETRFVACLYAGSLTTASAGSPVVPLR